MSSYIALNFVVMKYLYCTFTWINSHKFYIIFEWIYQITLNKFGLLIMLIDVLTCMYWFKIYSSINCIYLLKKFHKEDLDFWLCSSSEVPVQMLCPRWGTNTLNIPSIYLIFSLDFWNLKWKFKLLKIGHSLCKKISKGQSK